MICPNCQISTVVDERNYGALYTCAACSSVYFLNFEGNPEYGDMEIAAPLVEEVAPIAEIPAQDNPSDPFALPQENNMDSFSNPTEIPPTDNSYAMPIDQSMEDFSQQMPPLEEQPQIEEAPMAAYEPAVAPPQVVKPPPTKATKPVAKPVKQMNNFSDVAKDLADFGNSETQVAGLNYDLTISGLDTIEINKLFKEAIDDVRLGWDVNEMMRSVKNGMVHFERLNPAKAFILAKRIQFLDIEKTWTQNVLS